MERKGNRVKILSLQGLTPREPVDLVRVSETLHLTDNLSLRPPANSDAHMLAEIFSKPTVRRFLSFSPPTAEEQLLYFEVKRRESAVGSCRYFVLEKQGIIIGSLELRREGARTFLGYALDNEYWGLGIGSKSVAAVQQEVIRCASIPVLWARAHVLNEPSIRLLRRQGFKMIDGSDSQGDFPNLEPNLGQAMASFFWEG